MVGRRGTDQVLVGQGASASGQSVVTIGQFFGILRRRIAVVVLLTLAGVFAGGALLHGTPKTYAATAVVLITPTSPTGDLSSVSNVTESRIVTSTSVIRRAARTLDYRGTTTSLAGHVTVSSPLDSQLLNITFASTRGTRAADGANAFANAYLAYRRRIAQQELKLQADLVDARIAHLQETLPALQRSGSDTERTSVRNQIQQLERRLNAYETSIVTPGHLVGPAVAPGSPASPRSVLYLAGGLLIGLFAGCGLAVVRDRKDDRIREATQLERSLDAPTIAVSETSAEVTSPVVPAAIAARRSDEADAYRSLAAALTSRPPRGQVVVLCSTGSEGFSLAPLNLACTFALQGMRTVLAGPHHALEPALAPLEVPRLTTAVDAGLRGRLTPTRLPSLRLLPLGDEVPLDDELPPVAALRQNVDKLAELVGEADTVVVDGINVELPSTSTQLAVLADAAVVVAYAGRTTHTEVERLIRQLAQGGTSVAAGVLVNRRNPLHTLLGKARRDDAGMGSESDEEHHPRQLRDVVVLLGAKRRGALDESIEPGADEVSTSTRTRH